MERKYPTPQQVGRAGELFVAAELNRRGVLATLYLINTPRVDVVASSPVTSKTIAIQVKTKGPQSRAWQGNISRIKEEVCGAADTDFIIFVSLNSLDGVPDYYVCNLREFAQKHLEQHNKWLMSKGGLRPRNKNSTHTSIQLSEVENGKDK